MLWSWGMSVTSDEFCQYDTYSSIVVFGFGRLVHEGGARRQRQYWHLVTLSTRVGRRWQIGRQDLRLDLVAKTRGFVTIDALSMIFLLFCLASFFSFFSPPFPAVFSLLLAWSLQQPSAPLQDGNNNNKQQQQQLLDVDTVIFFYMSHQTSCLLYTSPSPRD